MLENEINGNKIGSDNKVCLFGNAKLDIHLEELALMFFAPIRNAFIQTKLLQFYEVQAESISNILNRAKEIADKHGIPINQLSPKLGLPILEKMSLETDDKEMQEKWAKLLVAAESDETQNLIFVQYADVLSQIKGEEAKLLKLTYDEQSKMNGFSAIDKFKEFSSEINQQTFIREILEKIESKLTRKSSLLGQTSTSINLTSGLFSLSKTFNFPYIKKGDEEKIITNHKIPPMDLFINSKNILNSLILLKQLNLLEYYFLPERVSKDSFIPKWGILLTSFGYNFVKTLEDIDNKNETL